MTKSNTGPASGWGNCVPHLPGDACMNPHVFGTPEYKAKVTAAAETLFTGFRDDEKAWEAVGETVYAQTAGGKSVNYGKFPNLRTAHAPSFIAAACPIIDGLVQIEKNSPHTPRHLAIPFGEGLYRRGQRFGRLKAPSVKNVVRVLAHRNWIELYAAGADERGRSHSPRIRSLEPMVAWMISAGLLTGAEYGEIAA